MAEHKDEGLMDKILTLVAPPLPPSSQKGRGGGKKNKAHHLSVPVVGAASGSNLNSMTPTTMGVRSSSSSALISSTAQGSQRHSGMQNHSYCDACGDGGSLLCCDNCPTSFHFNCCDPPVDPKNIPSGDWLCRRCREDKVPECLSTLFQPLVRAGLTANPLVFNLPYELQRRDILPGCSRKELKQARLVSGQLDRETEGKDVKKSCYKCNKGTNIGRMASCDFCPLMFHLDCLDPPLTIPPTAVWMCPIHPNNRIPGFDHPRLSERLKALERGQASIPYHSIKADFIRRVRKIPPYRRVTKHHNRRVTEVPASIKSLYAHPIADVKQVLPLSDSLLTPEEDVQRWRTEEEATRKQATAYRKPTITRDQDEWTRTAIQCQLHSSQKPPPPIATSNHPSHSTEVSASSKGPSHSTEISASSKGPSHSTEISASSKGPYHSTELSIGSKGPSHSSEVSMLLAAHQLLELSKGRVCATNRPDQPKPSGLGTGKHEIKLNGLVSPLGSVGSDSVAGNGICLSMETNGELTDSIHLDKGGDEKDGTSERDDGKPVRMELGDGEGVNGEEDVAKKCSLNGNGVSVDEDVMSEDGEAESGDGLLTKPRADSCSITRTRSLLESERKEDGTGDSHEPTPLPPAGVSASSCPSKTSRSASPCPSQTNRSASPHPSKKSTSPSLSPSQASRSTSPCLSKTNSLPSPRPSQISSLETPEDMETSSSDDVGGTLKSKDGMSVDGQTEENPISVDAMRSNSWEDIFVPDLSQLNPKMVELLALQRISELLSDSHQAAGGAHSMETVCPETLTGNNHGQIKEEEDQVSSGKKLAQQAAAILPGLATSHLPPPSKASLLSASAILCPLSGTACAALLNKPVTSVGLGSEVDINLLEFGHCDFVSSKQACIFYDKITRDYELINYSEHGTVVDGVLYSCDFSNKSHHSNAPSSSNGYFGINGMTTPLHRNTSMDEAVTRLQHVRKTVRSKEDARRAVEKAIRMATPIKDDLSLAEEMSKCEGLMTRTGLKRVAAESANSHAVNNSSLPGSSTFLSIPLAKTKKSESAASSPPRKSQVSSKVSNKLNSRVQNSPKRQSIKRGPPIDNISPCHQSQTTQDSKDITTVDEPMEAATCDCRGSLTSLVGSNGKGWEGTATLTHGSRLRFGCVQFILSVTGQPGHSELIQALSSIHESNFD